jgi:hypothetical protein
MEHNPFESGAKYEHGVGVEVKKEDTQKILDLLKLGPLDYGQLREQTGFDDALLNSALNLLTNHNKIKDQDHKLLLIEE